MIYKNSLRKKHIVNKVFIDICESFFYSLDFSLFKAVFFQADHIIDPSCNVFFVDDTKNNVGAFKIRGAYNSITTAKNRFPNLKGIVAASSGSFGMSCAICSKNIGLSSKIFVPKTAPSLKVDKIRELGGDVEVCGNSYEDSKALAIDFSKNDEGYYFQDGVTDDVFVGNSSLAYELIEFIKHNEINGNIAVVIPLGIGSLLVPVSRVLKAYLSNVSIISVEPLTHAKLHSFNSGFKPSYDSTLADGASVKFFPEFSKNHVLSLVDYYTQIDEESISNSMLFFKNINMKFEGAAAMTYAVYKDNSNFFSNFDSVFLFMTGSNVS